MTSIPVTLLIARSLGPESFGRLGVALGISGIVMLMAQLGLDRLLRRDLAERPLQGGALMGTAAVLYLGAALFAGLAATAYAEWGIGDLETRRLVLILAWSAIPQFFAPADQWFQSAGHPRKSVGVRSVILILFALARVYATMNHWAVVAFAWFVLAEWSVTAVAIYILMLFQSDAPRWQAPSSAAAAGWVREGWTVFLMLSVGAAFERTDILVLNHLASAVQTGYYSAAQRFSEFWWSLSVTAATALLPWLARTRVKNREKFLENMQHYLDASVGVTIFAGVAGTLLAPFLVTKLLGAQYAPAANVLIILCWTAPAVYVEVARSQYLLMERKLYLDVTFNLIHMCITFALCVYLTPRFGALGAAWARFSAFAFVVWILPWFFPATRRIAGMQWRAFLFFLRIGSLSQIARELLVQRRKPRAEFAAVSSGSAAR